MGAHRLDAGGLRRGEPPRGLLDQVAHDLVDHAPDHLVDEAAAGQLAVAREHRVVLAREQRHAAQLLERHQAGAQAVVDVVVVVGDGVGEVRDLRLEARLAALDEALPELAERARVRERAVLQDPLARLEA